MGACTTAGSGKETTTVKCVAESAITTRDYFYINTVDGAGDTVTNHVWFQIDTVGADPAPGTTGIEVDIASGDTADQVADKLKVVMALEGNYGATVVTDTVTIVTAANGAVEDATDYNTDFTIIVTVQGASTHAITKATDETPIWLGFHVEKEGTNTSQRKDIMGIVPSNLNISVSEANPIAKQTYTGEYSYNTPGQATELAEPSELVQAKHPPFTWFHYRSSSGTSAFTYNAGAAINVDIIGLNINFGWTKATFGTYDANGYPNIGYVNPPFTTRVTIECIYKDHTGADIQTISDLDHAAQAGDLTLIVDFYEDATNYIKFTFTDMFIDPESFEEVWQSEGDWFDGFRFDLVFRNETSSLALSAVDALNDTHYKNP